MKDKKEAVKFELKYKKIKFIEKRKVIRHIEHLAKEIAGNPKNKEELESQKKEWQ